MRQAFSPAKCAVLKFTAQSQSSSHTFILSPQHAALTAVLLTCTLENQISAPVSYLLTDFSAMTGFRPDGLRRFGTVLCAQLRSSGFPYSLAPKPARRQASVTVHRIAYFIFHIRRRHAPHRYYTRPGAKMQALSALPQIFCCAAANLLQDSKIPTCASAHKPRSCFLNAGAASSNVAQRFRYWRGVAPSWVRKV